MHARAVIGFLALSGAAVALYEIMTGNAASPARVNKPTTIGQTFLGKLAAIESSGNALAKNARSSASGLYQFLKPTWQALGGAWGLNPDLPFGGLMPSAAEQTARAQQLVAQNAGILSQAGITATDTALYAAHFLGAAVATRVLSAPDTTPLEMVVSRTVITANPFLANMTVAGFKTWLRNKVG